MAAADILIVEDDEMTREVLAEFLESEGYSVYQAPDGRPALERMRTHPVGLVVLLDLMMPGMDGYAVLQAVAAESSKAPKHAYILMSATGRFLPTKVIPLLKQLNVSSLSKPFDLDELLAAVQKAASRLQKPSR
jgi:two-component system response regulator FlrC